jgi:hypothetical protein
MTKSALVGPWLAVVAVLVSGASCGGDGGTCSMVSNCGGDIVGDWTITSSCIKASGTMADSNCPTATLSASATVSGTSSFRTDLSYDLSWSFTGSETVSFPASCLTQSGVTVTCDQLNQAVAAGGAPAGLDGLHCTNGNGGGCNCNVNLPGQTMIETGTYVTSAGTVTTTPAGSTGDPRGYCVQGSRLDMTPPPGMMDPGLTSTGDITFMRR